MKPIIKKKQFPPTNIWGTDDPKELRKPIKQLEVSADTDLFFLYFITFLIGLRKNGNSYRPFYKSKVSSNNTLTHSIISSMLI